MTMASSLISDKFFSFSDGQVEMTVSKGSETLNLSQEAGEREIPAEEIY